MKFLTQFIVEKKINGRTIRSKHAFRTKAAARRFQAKNGGRVVQLT